MATQKKITRVEGPAGNGPVKTFTPTALSKGKAGQLRTFAVVLWVVALAAQVWAILHLLRAQPVNTTWIIIAIAVDLVAVVAGSLLWKRSNRYDPATRAEKFKFFMQSQLGLFATVVAFVPLVIFILGSKNIDKKQKTLLGAIAGGALVIAAMFGIDFNPPSVEQYTEEANRVEWLNGQDFVYWTKAGTVYHLYNDCSYINTDRTTEIFEGTVAQAHEMKKLTELCSRCESRAIDEHGLDEADYHSPSETLTE